MWVLRALIRELKSPYGESEAELISNLDEVLSVLSTISSESPPRIKMMINDAIQTLRAASSQDGMKISSVIGNLIAYLENEPELEVEGLIMRLETLIRRDLPISGDYDTPQSNLKPPFDPSKAGRYNVIG